jgi:tetratricopeptide (TPR) repeat protein
MPSPTLQLDPQDDLVYLQRGRLWCQMDNYDRAVHDLTRALRLCPHRAGTYTERSLAYLGGKEYDRALADCNEALLLDPDWTDAYSVRADVYTGLANSEANPQEGEADSYTRNCGR